MSIKDFIQLVEQADIPNMQVLGPLDDGFANIRYNGMAGVLDQQTNKMILISPKVPDSFHIVTVAGGRETTQYVGGSELGPATKKALDSITPRQRPRPPAPLPSQESYESTEQVRSIVQRMMEDARVPQKPRQGPLRPQTGAGKHKDKKKDQKQGKEKHKGKNLDESNIPFAGLGKHKIGQAGQLRSPGPTGYPKGKLVGGAAESRFGRNRDDQFSLGGRMPRTDRIDRDSSSGQDAQQRMERKLKQQTIDRLLDKGFKIDALNGKSLPELIQMLREGIPYSYGFVPGRKKPNATTRHLRDYPVSDKDVAKPVKKPEKKKPEQGLAEMDKSQPSHGRDGKISHSTYGSRDKEGSDYFKGKEVPVKPITVKKMEKDALDILKKQGVAEGSDKLQGTPVVSLKDLDSKDTKKNKYGQTVPKKLKKDDPRVKFHKDEKQGVAEGSGKNVVKSVKVGNFRHDLVDTGMGWQVRIYNGDELYDTGMSKNSEQKGLAALEDAVAYTEKQTRTKRQGVSEGEGKTQKYEMMMRNGQVKKFIAKDDADAKRIAAGHGAKSVIRLRGGIPAGKVAEQGVSEGWGFDQWGHDTWTDAQKEVARKKKNEKQRAQRQQNKDQQNKDQQKSKEQGVSEGYSTLDLWNMSPKEVVELLDAKKITYDEFHAYQDLVINGGPDEDDDFDYTDYSMRQGERGMEEEKIKGVDGKACWKGYKRMGTKKKGGRTVDNCVKVGEDSYMESLWSQLDEYKFTSLPYKGQKKEKQAPFALGSKHIGKAGGSSKSKGALSGMKASTSKDSNKPVVSTEAAPPGDKYERMVKHIKKGYAKDGKITDKERSIAYATAWKAKNKAKK